MLTVHELVTGPGQLLRYAGTTASARPDATHPVRRVVLCDAQGRPPAGARSLDVLAVVPGNGDRFIAPYAVLRGLVDWGVVALVLTPDRAGIPLPSDVVAEAQRLGLTLLVPSDAPSDARMLRERLLIRQVTALQGAADRRARLVGLAERLDRQGQGPGKLVQALAGECGAHAVILAGPEHPTWELLAQQHWRALDRVRSGQVRAESATLSGTGEYLLLCAVGTAAPHQVLAAIRPEPWPRDLRVLAEEAAGMAHRLQRTLDHQAADDRIQQALSALRQSVFQLLMTGHDAPAVRVVAPLKPEYLPADLLTGEAVRVAVMECAEGEDRAEVAAEVAKAGNSRALIVQCPVEHRQLIIVEAQTPGTPELSKALVGLIGEPGRAVGISSRHSWPDTSIAYNSAHRSLAAARHSTPRLVVDGGGASVASLLPPEAVYWAHALLRGLDDRLPARHRETYLSTARVTLNFGLESAARLGYDQSTIWRHLKTVMGAVGLDRGQLADRAVFHLALQIEETRKMPTNEEADAAGAAPALAMLLTHGTATSAAERFLSAVGDEGINDLTTWISCNGQIKRAAEARGIGRKRLSNDLDAAGAALSLSPTRVEADAYEVYWALVLTGRLPGHTVPDPVSLVSV
ncbi:hypothetical protein [Streptomyces sp. NPDC050428]|uniref:hypothetical protein n=1 Tax=Streptomyces sp. NPDC050428 TaxID=3155757 RepID=UPI00342AF79A